MIGMILELHKYMVKKWISLRLAAQEFYFKQPFEIKDEYPIMKSILFFALAPMELIFIFLYARFFGSLMRLSCLIGNWIMMLEKNYTHLKMGPLQYS